MEAILREIGKGIQGRHTRYAWARSMESFCWEEVVDEYD